MTRPHIVRADTIDLQSADTPSAAEHHKPLLQGGLAPHQRAEVHHVMEERTSEEHALADAWRMADDLTEEPGMIDEAQHQHNLAGEPHINGVRHGEEEEGGGSEVDADDDMLDRVSSSPSIDDGGYPLPRSSPAPRARAMIWPERKSSLSPSPRKDPPPTSPSPGSSSPVSSSPFQHTPQHLPLHARATGRSSSALSNEISLSFSWHEDDEEMVSLERREEEASFVSEHHQQSGRYGRTSDSERLPRIHLDLYTDEGFYDNEDDEDGFADTPHSSAPESTTFSVAANTDSRFIHDRDLGMILLETPRGNAFSYNSSDHQAPNLQQSPSLSSMASWDLQSVLLPVDDPLLDRPTSPNGSTSSWESVPISEEHPTGNEEGGNDADDADDTDAVFLDLDERFIDSGWGGECLRETENIDFEFVYAFHTFVATVEGQANATKGDTMVLLDDSNSYWWLVRVVKDGTIGYLPAEHIETPTERLARLNKHRNIDLSATMLGDQSEKTRNPLKKLRRRNMKAVTFAAPTYVEASDYEYDDDEEEEEGAGEAHADEAAAEKAEQNGDRSADGVAGEQTAAQEEAPRTSTPTRGSFDREQAATLSSPQDEPQVSPKLIDKTEAAPLKSRKTRNTDSFLKDDSMETRKITLTPGILRDEQGKGLSAVSSGNDSMESLVKSISPSDSLGKKDSKKDKDKKKEGKFRGFFKSKKKDKKAGLEVEAAEEKLSADYSGESGLTSPVETPVQESIAAATSPVDTRSPADVTSRSLPPVAATAAASAAAVAAAAAAAAAVQEPDQPPPAEANVAELEGSGAGTGLATVGLAPLNTALATQEKTKESPLSPITNILKRDDSKSAKPTKVKRSKQRVELDDFDSPEHDDGPDYFDGHDARDVEDDEDEEDRLSEDPIEITSSSLHGTESIHVPTPGPYDERGLEEDEEDEDGEGVEEPESMTSSPSLIEHPAEPLETPTDPTTQDDSDSTPRGPRSPNPTGTTPDAAALTSIHNLSTTDNSATTWSRSPVTDRGASPATSISQQSWSDTSLRSWLEDGSEVKDMLVLIHDKSGVVPVSDDHPLMAGLFTEQKKGVQDMMTQLDGLLGSYLQRKGIEFG